MNLKKLNKKGDMSTIIVTIAGLAILSYGFIQYMDNNITTIKYENLSQSARDALLTIESKGIVEKNDMLDLKQTVADKLGIKSGESLNMQVKVGNGAYYDVNNMPNTITTDFGDEILVKMTLNYLNRTISLPNYLSPTVSKKMESMVVELSSSSKNRATSLESSASGNTKPNTPAITISPSTNLRKTTNITIDAIATDPDGDPVRYEWEGRPSRVSKYDVGTHAVSVIAIDSHGAESEPATIVFDVGNDAPSTPQINITSNTGSFTSTSDITITASSSDPNGDNIQYIWSGRPNETSKYSIGRHTVSVYAVDEYGAESAAANVSFDVLNSAPSAPIIDISKKSSIGPKDLIRITAKSTDADGDMISYVWTGRPNEISTYSTGTHTVSVYAVDSRGAKSPTTTLTFTVVNSAPTKPTIERTPRMNIRPDTEVTIRASGSQDTDGDEFTYVFEGRIDETSTYPMGKHTIKCYAIDKFGNKSEVATDTFEVTNTAPETPDIVITPNGKLRPNTNITITASSFDADGDEAEYHWTGRNGETSTYSAGRHTVSVYATDQYGGRSGTATKSFDVVNGAPTTPVITLSQTSKIRPDTKLKITASSSDPDGDPITYVWSGRNGETSTYSVGTHTVTVYAVDSFGVKSGTASVTFTVENSAPTTPTIYMSPENGLRPNTNITISASSSDPDGDDIEYIWTSGSAGTRQYGVGTHTVSVYARDRFGATSAVATRTFTISNRAPSTPVITRYPDGSIISPGSTVRVNASSSDPDGDPITYHWENRPSEYSKYPLGKNVITVYAEDPYGAKSPKAATAFFVADSANGGGLTLVSSNSVINEDGIEGATIIKYTFNVPSVDGHSAKDYGLIKGFNRYTNSWEQIEKKTTKNGVTMQGTLPAGKYTKLQFSYYTPHTCMYNKSNITYSVDYEFNTLLNG